MFEFLGMIGNYEERMVGRYDADIAELASEFGIKFTQSKTKGH